MDNLRVTNVEVRDSEVVLSHRNFRGLAEKFNSEGRRYFNLRFENVELAQDLADLGWPIKIVNIDRNDPDSRLVGYLKVNVNFNNPKKPVTIKQITPCPDGQSRKRTLDNASTGFIDSADIQHMKFEIEPSKYEDRQHPGQFGISAYLKTMHFTLTPDVFDMDEDEKDVIDEDVPDTETLPFDVE